MYRLKLQKAQLYLKHCLQVAQDNGFLDLILNKDKDQESLLSPTITQPSISPTPGRVHPELAPVVDQAKINGWYIHPHEVSHQFIDT